MAIEHIEDYWRGGADFGLRRREWFIQVDCTGTPIEKIVPKQTIRIATPKEQYNELCKKGLVPFLPTMY